MIARISRVLMLACIVSSIGIQADEALHTKGVRRDPVVIQAPQQEAWLTKDQAQHILTAVEMLVQQMRDLSRQNKAPRDNAPGVCDPAYPGCGLVDLSAILSELCSIQNQIFCLCERTASISDVVGACTDISTLLGSQVDKSCIDSLCLSVVSLLKTILLELRGNFTGPFTCTHTP
jgi:hypothetical protein